MQVSVCLGAILIPEYLDFHSGYSAPRSRIAGIYSGIYSYSGIYPKRTRPYFDLIFCDTHCDILIGGDCVTAVLVTPLHDSDILF